MTRPTKPPLVVQIRDQHDFIETVVGSFFHWLEEGQEADPEAGETYVEFFRAWVGGFHHALEEQLFEILAERAEVLGEVALGDVYLLHILLELDYFGRRCHRRYIGLGNTVNISQEMLFLLGTGKFAPCPKHKPVYLDVGKWGSARSAIGYLAGNNDKRPFQAVGLPLDSDLLLLHGLKEGGLGARRGAVEFIG